MRATRGRRLDLVGVLGCMWERGVPVEVEEATEGDEGEFQVRNLR